MQNSAIIQRRKVFAPRLVQFLETLRDLPCQCCCFVVVTAVSLGLFLFKARQDHFLDDRVTNRELATEALVMLCYICRLIDARRHNHEGLTPHSRCH